MAAPRPDFRDLHFKPWERRALSALLTLLMVAVGSWAYYRYQPLTPKTAEDFEIYQWWLAEERLRDSLHLQAFRGFDPNLCDSAFLSATGMPLPALKMFLNYRRKGGQFYGPADLKKLYAMDSLWLSRALSFARFPEPPSHSNEWRDWSNAPPPWQQRDTNMTETLRLVIPVDINSAGAQELATVPGIGDFRAQEIMALRKQYGGFHHLRQLEQLYKVDSSDLKKWQAHLYCGPARRHWDINRVPLDSLITFPGVDRRQAQAIHAFRSKIRPFLSVDELRLLELVDEGLFAKIAPYLYVDGKNGADSAN